MKATMNLPTEQSPIKNIKVIVKVKLVEKKSPIITKRWTIMLIRNTGFRPYMSAILGTKKHAVSQPTKIIIPMRASLE